LPIFRSPSCGIRLCDCRTPSPSGAEYNDDLYTPEYPTTWLNTAGQVGIPARQVVIELTLMNLEFSHDFGENRGLPGTNPISDSLQSIGTNKLRLKLNLPVLMNLPLSHINPCQTYQHYQNDAYGSNVKDWPKCLKRLWKRLVGAGRSERAREPARAQLKLRPGASAQCKSPTLVAGPSGPLSVAGSAAPLDLLHTAEECV
jgi:hypothetical protein